jgi:DNA-binding response OmpR family regulator
MATESRDPRPPAARQRALVIEDDAGVRKLLGDVLEIAHIDPDLAGSGDEALAALAHRSYDIVITDYHLPGPDGLAVAAAARSRCPTVPIIVITGAPERLDARATDTPGIRVLYKPFSMTVLMVTVRELLAGTPGEPPTTADSEPRVSLMSGAAEAEEDPGDKVCSYDNAPIERQAEQGVFEIFKRRGRVWFGIPSLSRWWALAPAEARRAAARLMQAAAEAEEDPGD